MNCVNHKSKHFLVTVQILRQDIGNGCVWQGHTADAPQNWPSLFPGASSNSYIWTTTQTLSIDSRQVMLQWPVNYWIPRRDLFAKLFATKESCGSRFSLESVHFEEHYLNHPQAHEGLNVFNHTSNELCKENIEALD